MSFCEHCQGQRFDRAQVLRTLRALRRQWRAAGRRARCEALDAAMGEMVRTDEWQALLKERGWVDMYQPAEEFAAFLTPERTRIEGILRDVGLVQ